jgi:hypothetical protein
LLCLIVDTSVPANMLHALLQRVRRSHPQATIQVCALPREGQVPPADLLIHLAGVDLITHDLTAACQALEACVHPPASHAKAESLDEPEMLLQPAVS